MTKLNKTISRLANRPLGANYGSDREKKIVITLAPGNGRDVDDLIELRPERTRRAEVVTVHDIYLYALRCRVNRTQLDKARERKKRKAELRERAAIARAEKRLTRPLAGGR